MKAYYILCVIIPLVIFFMSFNTLDKRIRNNRLKYAIFSVFSVLVNGYLVYYEFVVGSVSDMPIVVDYPLLQIVPTVLVLISFIFYKKGRSKEAIIDADRISDSVEEMRFRKRSERTAIDIVTSDDESNNSEDSEILWSSI